MLAKLKAFYATNTKAVLIGIAIAVVLAFATLIVKSSSAEAVAKQKYEDQISQLNAQIAARDAQIASRDSAIKVRDVALAALKKQDSTLAVVAASQQTQLDSSKRTMAMLKASIDSDAVTHQSLVPLPAVHQLELKYDGQVKSCEDLKTTDEARIADLTSQVANLTKTVSDQNTTRAQQDSNTAASKTILKDTVAVLRPPWWRRTLSWVGDHSVTLLIGAAGGVIISKKI
jgi:hypothetical protein